MYDAHCHVSASEGGVSELLVGRDFFGLHPWEALNRTEADLAREVAALRETLLAHPEAGVGEIGLDRLRVRDIPRAMETLFEAQLSLAFELNRPVVLHGAKCWGRVVKTIRALWERTPPPPRVAFLFHGFSRAGGLVDEIVSLRGFFSVGPAVLNAHAVNYRALVASLPVERLLVETDRTQESAADCPPLRLVLEEVAHLKNLSPVALERVTDANTRKFFGV